MAKLSMKCHHDTPSKSVSDLSAEIRRQVDGEVSIRYHLQAEVDELKIDRSGAAVRRDGLWKTTCFEAFFRQMGSDAYFEYNFAPSGAWAAYHFAGYRDGMTDLPMVRAPRIVCAVEQNQISLQTFFKLPDDLSQCDVSVAITAVIEEADGMKSYWSLAHPDSAPDFHHPDCFTFRLTAPAQP